MCQLLLVVSCTHCYGLRRDPAPSAIYGSPGENYLQEIISFTNSIREDLQNDAMYT